MGECIHLLEGSLIQSGQKLFLQRINLCDGILVLLTVNVVDSGALLTCLHLLHRLFLQGNQLVGEAVHIVNHLLFFVRNTDFLHGRHTDIPVFQGVDFVPVIVVMFLVPGGCVGAHFVGQIGGTVHKTVGIIGQLKAVLVGTLQLPAYITVCNQKHQHKQQCADRADIQDRCQRRLIDCFFHSL